MSKIYGHYLSPENVKWLTDVYRSIYNEKTPSHIPMLCEIFHEINIMGERFISCKRKGNASSFVVAEWAETRGTLAKDPLARVGKIMYFMKHCVALLGNGNDDSKRTETNHIFAKIHWLCNHPRQHFFPSPFLVVGPLSDMDYSAPATFIPLSCILCRCAIIPDRKTLDYGEDSCRCNTS